MKLIRAHQMFPTHHQKNSSCSFQKYLAFLYSCRNSIPILSSPSSSFPLSLSLFLFFSLPLFSTHAHLLGQQFLWTYLLCIFQILHFLSTQPPLPQTWPLSSLTWLLGTVFLRVPFASSQLQLMQSLQNKCDGNIPNFSIIQLIYLKNLLDAKSCLQNSVRILEQGI